MQSHNAERCASLDAPETGAEIGAPVERAGKGEVMVTLTDAQLRTESVIVRKIVASWSPLLPGAA